MAPEQPLPETPSMEKAESAPHAVGQDSEILHGAERFGDGVATSLATSTKRSPEDARRKPGVITSAALLVQSFALSIAIALFAITFLVQAFQIPSESMQNTLLVGDYLLVDKVRFAPRGTWEKFLAYQPIHQGDIVVFHYPVDPAQYFVKRVVGVPGDRIQLLDKRVWVNGKRMDDRSYAIYRTSNHDSYRDDFPSRQFNPQIDPQWIQEMGRQVHDGQLTVPANNYFVMGDNRDDSSDSRYWGFVPRTNIVGTPVLIYFSAARKRDDDIRRDGKLARFAQQAEFFWENIRWRRFLRVVK